MTSVISPVQLYGLKQAAYVMDCLVKHQSEEIVAKSLGGDEQLVNMWVLFLRHNHWVTENLSGWTMTTKGALWREKVAVANAD